MYLHNTKDITNGSFVIGDTQYPPNWLQFSTPEERDALGIVWADDPVQPPPTPEQIEAQKKELIRQISHAAREYVEEQANAALQDQLYRLYNLPDPHAMVVAIINWGKSIYNEAEVRKAMVQAGVADDPITLCDFNSFGEKPYTVYQLYVAGLVQL